MIKLNTPKKILVISAILMIIIISSVQLYHSTDKQVLVYIDNKVTAFNVTENTVRELLYVEDIEINKDDYINVDLDNSIKDGMEIIIRRAVPITLYNGEEKVELNTVAKDVKTVIEKLGIEVDGNDRVIPSLEKSIIKDMEIKIVKVEEKIYTIIDKIPYDIIENLNKQLFKGEIVEIESGEEGKMELKVKQVYENGKLIEDEIKDIKLIKAPVTQIVEKGIQDYIVSSRGKVSYEKSIVMSATAYDLSYESIGKKPGDAYYGITASGTKARAGVVAVDSSVIPLGTKLYIKSLDGSEDYGFAIAEDTGGAIKGNRIDLFMDNHQKALEFGRRKVKVYILE